MPAGAHALWSGTLSFGLVSVPVAVVTAVRSRRSAFHKLHRPDVSRLERRMYCPEEKVFVHPEHIVRGYEIEEGKFVIVRDSEIESVAPKRSSTIEIQEFVDSGEIDPARYERPYYIVPTGAEKPYTLLVEVLAETGRTGIAELVMHAREHLVAVQSIEGVLCLLILRYPRQLRSADEVTPKADAAGQYVKEMKAAIDDAGKDFEPGKLQDEYQKRIDELIHRKKYSEGIVEGAQVEEEETKGAPAGGAGEKAEDMDLVAALEESLAREKGKG
ncbi:MAG: Ku protein [Phycisphaerae bacterium]